MNTTLETYLIKYQKLVLGLLIILVVIIFELLRKAWPKNEQIKNTSMETPNPFGNLLKGFKLPSLPDIEFLRPQVPSVPYVPGDGPGVPLGPYTPYTPRSPEIPYSGRVPRSPRPALPPNVELEENIADVIRRITRPQPRIDPPVDPQY